MSLAAGSSSDRYTALNRARRSQIQTGQLHGRTYRVNKQKISTRKLRYLRSARIFLY